MTAAISVADLHAGFTRPAADCRPMMRWWWFGPDTTRTEIDRELRAMADAGIGGVEVAAVYPLADASPAFGSPEFLGHVRYAADRCAELELRFDLTLGSGWSFGGPHIDTDLAASALHWERREIPPGARQIPARGWPDDRLVAAFLGTGSAQEPPRDCSPLPVTDDLLQVPEGSGPRQLILGFCRPTGQVVKRAAAGADGPVLDHYSAEAVRRHLEAIGEPMLAAVPAELIGSVFCDSLEVYGANWTPALPAEFERRRGYRLLPRLYELIIDGPGAADLREDYYRTLTELYQENFVAQISTWSSGHGVPFRIQGYGTPPASVSSYRGADLYEGEGWGWTDLTQTRWASSAAHLDGLPVVSSETWTWTHSPSFRATPLDLKGEAHEHLLAGINQFIGHGWPYSPADADGLGWFFYAAGALDDRNPWWPAMPALMGYLQRMCWLLRQGEPVADVLIYLPTGDLHSGIGTEVGGTLDLWREARRYLGDQIPAVLRQHGWDFDLVDDDAVTEIDPDRVPVIILPGVTRLPADTQQWLDRIRTAGGTVLEVGCPGRPAAPIGSPAQLLDALRTACPPDVELTPNPGDIGAVHRRLPGIDAYVLINTGAHRREVDVRVRDRHAGYQLWSADDGSVVDTRSDSGVPVPLEPYQAAILVGYQDRPLPTVPARQPAVSAAAEPGETVRVDRGWQAIFEGSEDAVAVQVPHRWEDDPERVDYSGTVEYRTTIEVDPARAAGPAVLDFGPVRPAPEAATEGTGLRANSYRVHARPPVGEIVRVIVNDQDCGVLWSPPYRVDLAGTLREGSNSIRLLVSNTAANALSTETAIAERVEQSRHAFGQRFVMQDLDHAVDDVHSGLLAVPVISFGAGVAQ